MPDTELTTEFDWPEWSDIELTNGHRVRLRVAAGQIELEVTDPTGTTATATLHSAAATGIRAALDDAIANAFAAEHAAAFAVPPVTMTRLFSDSDDPTANLADLGRILAGKPWYIPDPNTPACGAKVPVPPESGYPARFFVCDRPADHAELRHRQVTDALAGSAIEWKE